jgi:hypothetical protein
MSGIKGRTIEIILMLICALIIFFDFIFVSDPLANLAGFLRTTGVIIAACTLGLGAVNIITSNMRRWPRSSTKDKVLGVYSIALMLIIILFGLLPPGIGRSEYFLWAYQNINIPLGQTVYSLTIFYIFYAAWRSFRVRSIEATILLGAGIIIMLYNIPLGSFVPGIPQIGSWLFSTPSAAGIRALEIATALGVVIMGFRTLIGRERSMAGSQVSTPEESKD